MTTTEVTRAVELDMGHRVPSHDGKCRNPHGHRYRLEVTVTGPVRIGIDDPEDGMVIDFARLAAALNVVHDAFDHAFAVAEHDHQMRAALAQDPSWKVVLIDGPPTAEVLAHVWGAELVLALAPMRVVRVRVYETPKSWADWRPA